MEAGAEDVMGTVKSWNGSKGYGFIISSGVQGDIMFARPELVDDHREVRGKFLDGKSVRFSWYLQPNGKPKATTVAVLYRHGEQVAGSIKSYSGKNGYGFVQSSSLQEDVLFLKTDLPNGVEDGNLQGQLVVFDVTRNEGKLRVERLMFQSRDIADKVIAKGGSLGMGSQQQAVAAMQPVAAMQQSSVLAMQQAMASAMGYGYPMNYPMGSMVYPMAAQTVAAANKAQIVSQVLASVGMQDDIPRVVAAMQQGCADGCGATQAEPLQATPGYMAGTVKSYSERNGYGFITSPGMPSDIRFGTPELQGASVAPGTPVQFIPRTGQTGGLQAQIVVPMAGAAQAPGGCLKRGLDGGEVGPAAKQSRGQQPVVESTGEFKLGVVKSFNMSKGFGFIKCPQLQEDVFFMKSDLPPEAVGGVEANQSVGFELWRTAEGKLRAQSISLA